MNDPYQNISTGGAPVLKASPSDGQSDSLLRPQQAPLTLNAHAQQALIYSKGWVRFLSVMGFISFAFIIIVFIGALFSISRSGGMGLIQLVIFGVLAFVVFMLASRLSKFASSITRMQLGGQPLDFEAAMNEQMKFWSLLGVLTIIWLVLALFGIMISLIV